MVSTAIYPDLGAQKPAAFSPAIVQGLLRDQLGFDGVVITDDLESAGIVELSDAPGAARPSARSGPATTSLLYATQRGRLGPGPSTRSSTR